MYQKGARNVRHHAYDSFDAISKHFNALDRTRPHPTHSTPNEGFLATLGFFAKFRIFSISTSPAPKLPPVRGCHVCTIPTPEHPRNACRTAAARVRPGTCQPQRRRNREFLPNAGFLATLGLFAKFRFFSISTSPDRKSVV